MNPKGEHQFEGKSNKISTKIKNYMYRITYTKFQKKLRTTTTQTKNYMYNSISLITTQTNKIKSLIKPKLRTKSDL